ncbi:morphogenesis protein (Msb1), putative [Cordyceps militaris CM01]|uniref:Morphogenesis protein (Msb1), putative n=1 Tax=Cordyceps militaris (strain CM01) TaxID=983644 RepID=G3JJY5_CORMM|nr:morphogenesis protein (Msb1), putative [Cordyceps militaris CM01]EGX91322.1 morphogenesis protein (Msb1), putative [Cordyceps militaris CM01]
MYELRSTNTKGDFTSLLHQERMAFVGANSHHAHPRPLPPESHRLSWSETLTHQLHSSPYKLLSRTLFSPVFSPSTQLLPFAASFFFFRFFPLPLPHPFNSTSALGFPSRYLKFPSRRSSSCCLMMPGIFSRINKARDARQKKKNGNNDLANSLPPKPRWDDAYTRTSVDPDEIGELVRCCTHEIKSRGLDHPFLLLPFRPTSNPSGVRTFLRNFFGKDGLDAPLHGERLQQEVRIAEPMVLASVLKWCWSRLQGGVVSWDAYELFKIGELGKYPRQVYSLNILLTTIPPADSKLARDSFKTFIPISVESDSRQHIIFCFFELVAAIAAHGKTNGLSGVKLSRMAAWWAFEQKDTGDGFDGGYKAWKKAADATTHLFFAYLRSLSPEQELTGITMLPRSLQKLLNETEYPPKAADMLVSRTNKLVMIVDSVSPTPFALLRRASKFEYRDSDVALRTLSDFDDATEALSEECRRVLKAISAANQSQASSAKHSTSLRDASWSRFEDIGFASALTEEDDYEESAVPVKRPPQTFGPSKSMLHVPSSAAHDMRPTTPSWADFLSTGFVDESGNTSTLVPPDQVLPPIDVQRQHSSQSHQPRLESERDLEPGELASITPFDLDDAFWWVWMSSLAPEETSERKSAFGRCAVLETTVHNGAWLVMEELIAGAAPDPQEGAYIAEKKGFFSWTKRSRTVSRRKSINKYSLRRGDQGPGVGSTTSVGNDTQAKIAAKAAQLRALQESGNKPAAPRRGRTDEEVLGDKTISVFDLQPPIAGEASSAMKWVKKYDKGAVKDAYLSNSNAGRGVSISPALSERALEAATNGNTNGSANGSAGAIAGNAKATERKPVPAASVESPVATPAPIEKADASKPEEIKAETAKHPETPVAPHPAKQEKTETAPAPPPKNESPIGSPAAQPVEAQQKSPAKEKGGLRKLFRKNRFSKLPENSAAQLNSMLQQDAAAAAAAKTNSADETPVETEAIAEPTLDNLEGLDGEVSKAAIPDLDAEGEEEFSRFDQGPLADQPAFVPENGDEDDAIPPPISRHTPEDGGQDTSGLARTASPGVHDRWAQIRKNASERASQRQTDVRDRSMPTSKSAADGEDEASGEETIESRVARIKARVAELTGNMEGTNSPPPVKNSA